MSPSPLGLVWTTGRGTASIHTQSWRTAEALFGLIESHHDTVSVRIFDINGHEVRHANGPAGLGL